MKRMLLSGAIGALTLTGSAHADLLEIGLFWNVGQGQIHYEGAFRDYITSERTGNTGQYTVIHIALEDILRSVGAHAIAALHIVDSGNNIYTSTPGADIDWVRFNGLSSDVTYSYDGPTPTHRAETPGQLAQRVANLDWGQNGGGNLPSMQFVSLGRYGTLTATLAEPHRIFGNRGFQPLTLDLSEAGNSESFYIYAENLTFPGPGSLVCLAMGLAAPSRRRRD
ncbi:MAG: hypothetical protein HRU76_00575 [Phycisphaeraceae bacterium]|nr:hypothetical protein [Phycisphaerales bacterium]QOJ16182.1 MAG: hypothetical protein HRU76_00575 [Phycisphaeraceae bacterium]